MLNILLSEADLAKLTHAQREFLVQRIDHALDNDNEIRKIIVSKLENALTHIDADVSVRYEAK